MSHYAELSPVELVRVCAGSRDPDAWAEFIRRFQPVIAAAVLRKARAYGDQPQLLDDLIQETYLKLCEDDSGLLRKFQPRGKDSIFGYLKVVAANVVHDHFKAELADKRGAGQTESLPDTVQIDARTGGGDPAASIYHKLLLDYIDQVLQQVTVGKDHERNCLIFRLRHFQGWTASEIAALPDLGLTTEGVESVLLRLSGRIQSHIANKSKTG